jgi:putative redox protein
MRDQESGNRTDASAQVDDSWITARNEVGGYRTDVAVRGHIFVVDEPLTAGGTDVGPTPYDYLLGALGACTAMTVRMYANRKGWALDDVVVRMRETPSYASDCEKCEMQAVGIRRIERRVELNGRLTDDQRERLLAIADRCPIKQTLERGLQIAPAV